MTPEQRAERGFRFQALLEDGELGEVLSGIESELVAEWRRTTDPAGRDNLWRSVQVIDRIRSFMAQAITSGHADALVREIRNIGRPTPFIG